MPRRIRVADLDHYRDPPAKNTWAPTKPHAWTNCLAFRICAKCHLVVRQRDDGQWLIEHKNGQRIEKTLPLCHEEKPR